MDELTEKLVSIENKLGGSQEAPETDDKLGWHLSYIESLIGGGSSDAVEDVKLNGDSVVEDKVASINLKTVNSESIIGSGDITIPSGSEVVANPTLEGDEGSLTGLEVDGTKYKMPKGSEAHCYEVQFMDYYGTTNYGYCHYYTDNDSITDAEGLNNDLKAKYSTQTAKPHYPVNYIRVNANNRTITVIEEMSPYINQPYPYVVNRTYTLSVANDTLNISVSSVDIGNSKMVVKKIY